MKLHQEVLALVSRGRAARVALADAIGWRARGRPRISEWVDTSGASAAYSVRLTLHNPTSRAIIIDSAAIMMGDEMLFPLSKYAENKNDIRRFPLHLAAGRSEPFDFHPPELANLVARHGGRGKVILHGVCQYDDERQVKGQPVLFDIRLANSPPFKASLSGQDPIATAWAWISDRYPRVQTVRRVGLADDVVYLTFQEMLAIREKADTRDQPGSTYRGQPIIDFSMWKTGDVCSGSLWRAVVVLGGGTRLELVESRD
jgi:hypothetical protein